MTLIVSSCPSGSSSTDPEAAPTLEAPTALSALETSKRARLRTRYLLLIQPFRSHCPGYHLVPTATFHFPILHLTRLNVFDDVCDRYTSRKKNDEEREQSVLYEYCDASLEVVDVVVGS